MSLPPILSGVYRNKEEIKRNKSFRVTWEMMWSWRGGCKTMGRHNVINFCGDGISKTISKMSYELF